MPAWCSTCSHALCQLLYIMVCRILRSAGLIGEVTATWRISPSDTAVFTTTSTTVVFADGESEVIVVVQVNLVILLTL